MSVKCLPPARNRAEAGSSANKNSDKIGKDGNIPLIGIFVPKLQASRQLIGNAVGQPVTMSHLLKFLCLPLLLASCGSWVQLTGPGQQVEVRSEGQVGACQSLGRASSSTLERLLLIERNTLRQEDELLTLARNEAGDMGGNAIVPMTEAYAGKQSFAVYRCP